MLKVSAGNVQGYKEISVPFTLLSKTDESKTLTIFLPGAGYTVQGPLLHYSTGIFLNKSFDVLHVNYQYDSEAYHSFSMEDIGEAVKFDARTVIDKVLVDNLDKYENYYFVGKSLGTIAMSSEINRHIFKDAKGIWLTPLLSVDEVLMTMIESHNEGLCFIGDKDHYYTEELFSELKTNKNIDSKLIPGVNHSLEYIDNVTDSIEVIKSIMRDIEQF